MSEREHEPDSLEEMMDPNSWEFGEDDAAPAALPRRAPRAILSVAFPREDFEQLERYAAEQNQKISEVVRNAAMAYVSGRVIAGAGIRVMSAGGRDLRSDVPLPPTTATGRYWEADENLDRTA